MKAILTHTTDSLFLVCLELDSNDIGTGMQGNACQPRRQHCLYTFGNSSLHLRGWCGIYGYTQHHFVCAAEPLTLGVLTTQASMCNVTIVLSQLHYSDICVQYAPYVVTLHDFCFEFACSMIDTMLRWQVGVNCHAYEYMCSWAQLL